MDIILTAAIVAPTVLALSSCVVITSQKSEKVIETLGKFSGMRTAGLGFKAPWPIQSVKGQVNMKTRSLSSLVGVLSSDTAFLDVPVTVQFEVVDGEKAFYKLDDPEGQMLKFVTNNIRSVANTMTMDELFGSNDAFREDVTNALNEKFKDFGYRILDVLVDDPQPSDEMKASFDLKLIARREKEAADDQAAALKTKMVGEAEAEKASLKLKGEALADLRDTIAKGNADAMNEMLEGVPGLTAAMVLDFFKTIDTNEANRDMAGKSNSTIIVGGTASSASENPVALIEAMIAASKEPKDVSKTEAQNDGSQEATVAEESE